MNELYPDICKATYILTKKSNLQIEYPLSQTCVDNQWQFWLFKRCKTLAINFVNTFKDYDYIVAPSGSCVSMVKEHYSEFLIMIKISIKLKASIYEVLWIFTWYYKIENLNLIFHFHIKVGFIIHATWT